MSMKQFSRDLGLHIRQKRIAHKLTVKKLSGRVGLSPSMISQLENGKNSASLDSLVSISKVLRLDLNKIISAKLPQPCPWCDGAGFLKTW